MLRPIDLRSLCYVSNDNSLIEKYRDYLNMDTQFRDNEISTLRDFTENLDLNLDLSFFYVGFKIPQINKEFDLLRFTDDFILNVELKSQAVSEKAIKKQLQKNLYYLNMFKKYDKFALFTVVEKSNNTFEVFCLKRDKLERISLDVLVKCLNYPGKTVNLSEICEPGNYLVSPFNSTDLFLKHKYFLTQAQQKIEEDFKNGDAGMYSLQGGAGTGKTLLAYDIAFNQMEHGKKVKIIHCASLNEGQCTLNEHDWDIIPIKEYKYDECVNYDVVIFDEFQRAKDFEDIIEDFKGFNGKVIFCGDPNQWLGSWEGTKKVFDNLKRSNVLKRKFKVTEKIRTNKEIAEFTKQLFNRKRIEHPEYIKSKNIYIEYFETESEALTFADNLDNKGWKIIDLTSSLYDFEYLDHLSYNKINSHKVIGQEFDKVAVFMGKNFFYDGDGKLHSDNFYYDAPKMLFENITRTKSKLFIIVVDNFEILRNCLEIVSHKPESD